MYYAALQKKPLAKTEAEKRILSIISDMHSPGQVYPLLGKLLRILVEAVHAKKVVEIGTSNGYSALWISLGLQTTNGRLITHEIRPDRAATARSNFKRAGVEDVITVVVGDAHQTIATIEGPIDILFIDAEKPGYADYLDKLFPKIRAGGLILADNANKPYHFPDFIKAITTNPDLETIVMALGRDPLLLAATRDFLHGRGGLDTDSFHRLRSAGVVIGNSAADCRWRCELYSLFLRRHIGSGG